MGPDLRQAGLGLLALAGLALWPAGPTPAEESDTVRVMRELEQTRAERTALRERVERLRESSLSRQRSRAEARAEADAERSLRRRDFPEDRTTPKYRLRIEPLGVAGRPR